MRESDLDDVVAIEQASFGSPWPRGAFLEELRSNAYARCLVARGEEGGQVEVVGYICFWMLADELLINNLAVLPSRRRAGVGRRLLRQALAEGRQAGCRSAFLEVRPSNEAALQLYQAHGFVVIGRRRAYYSDTREDALVMRASLKALESA